MTAFTTTMTIYDSATRSTRRLNRHAFLAPLLVATVVLMSLSAHVSSSSSSLLFVSGFQLPSSGTISAFKTRRATSTSTTQSSLLLQPTALSMSPPPPHRRREPLPYVPSPLFEPKQRRREGGSGKHKKIRAATVMKALAMTTLTSLTTALVSPRRVWAAAAKTTTTTTAQSLATSTALSSRILNIFYSNGIIQWKNIVRSFLTVWILSTVIHLVQVKHRQNKDATSEWNYYAGHPGARGRAIAWLLTEQALLVLFSETILRMKRSEVRIIAGRRFANKLLQLGPLYIKLGQIISCRKNLLGSEWITAMAKLQDQVPAKTGNEAMELAYSTMDDPIYDNLTIFTNATINATTISTNITTTKSANSNREKFHTIFENFDSTPIAAASLGQVHKATLRSNGDVVAVKVQRPYLRKIYDQDLALLLTIAHFMDRLPSKNYNVGGVQSSWTQIFEDAEVILYREIDYRDEANNAIRFCNDFGLTKDGKAIASTAKSRNNKLLPSAASWLRTPYVYDKISSERLLVMEYVPSIKITNTRKLENAGVTEEDKIDLADALARAYLRQFCCNLFFSTDPHPGNLGVEMVPVSAMSTSGPSISTLTTPITSVITNTTVRATKPRLVMYDFGQAASLNPEQADGILDIIEAIIDTDVERSVEAFQKMGVLKENADLDKVRAKVADNYKTGKIKANRKKLKRGGYKFKDEEKDKTKVANITQANTTATNVTGTNTTDVASNETMKSTTTKVDDSDVMSFFSLPAEYAFVARAISQMDGVGKGLDPDFDFISSAAPYIVEIKGADKYVKDEISKFFSNMFSWNTKK